MNGVMLLSYLVLKGGAGKNLIAIPCSPLKKKREKSGGRSQWYRAVAGKLTSWAFRIETMFCYMLMAGIHFSSATLCSWPYVFLLWCVPVGRTRGLHMTNESLSLPRTQTAEIPQGDTVSCISVYFVFLCSEVPDSLICFQLKCGFNIIASKNI